MKGHAEIVSLLLEKGANIESRTGVRAFLIKMLGCIALSHQLLTVVDLTFLLCLYEPLLQGGRIPALHDAAERGHADIEDILLETGVDIEAADAVRASPKIIGF